jgi:hypothetical protein
VLRNFKDLWSLLLEIGEKYYFDDQAFRLGELVLRLEAEMVDMIDDLSEVEGTLRVERKQVHAYGTRVWTWRAYSNAEFGLAKTFPACSQRPNGLIQMFPTGIKK